MTDQAIQDLNPTTLAPPAYEQLSITDHELFALVGKNRDILGASAPGPEVRHRHLLVQLTLTAPKGVTPLGKVLSGKSLKTTHEAMTVSSTTTYPALLDQVLARAALREILPAAAILPAGHQDCGAVVLCHRDGPRAIWDAASWDAGRELILQGEEGGVGLMFVCAVVEEGYVEREGRELERKLARERKKQQRKGKACVVM